MSEYSEGRREMSLGAFLEEQDSLEPEYARPWEYLRRFAGLDLTTIQNLEDLSAVASLAGRSIQSVLLAKCKSQGQELGEPAVGRPDIYKIKRGRDEKGFAEDREIVVVLDKGYCRIINCQYLEGDPDVVFTARVPFRDFHLLGRDEPRSIGSLQAEDKRFGKYSEYYPTIHPNNPIIIRGFAGVLQDGIKELLSALPEPTKVPEAFNF